jgi:hypothetical protein
VQGLAVQDATDRPLPAWMELQGSPDSWTLRLFVDDRDAAYPIEIESSATTPAWTFDGDQAVAFLGMHVATAGDVNADGYDEVIVGAPNYDNGAVNEGAAFLFLGSASGPSMNPNWVAEGDEPGALVGRSVGTAGDVDDDGYDDVIVGGPSLGSGGGVRVYHGSPTGPSTTPDWTVLSAQSSASFGFQAATAGDVNGDDYDDVIVGATLYDSPGMVQDGRAFVYHGSATGLSTQPAWVTAGGQSNVNYGIAVGTAGDVDGDGYDDVIVGAHRFDNGQVDEGRVYVYMGSAGGLSTVPAWTFENDSVEGCLGSRVGTAGDVNGDGYADAIVGAAYRSCNDFPSSPLGRAYTFYGSPSGLPDEPSWVAELIQTGANFGGVATAGDVNGDAYDDVVVGAHHFTGDQQQEGAAFLYLGSVQGLTITRAWHAEGNQTDTYFGSSPGAAGDVNGDGAGDVIIGAYTFDQPEQDEGAAFVYLGSATVTPAGSVPAATPLVMAKIGAEVELSWSPSCLASDTDYEIYHGELGDWARHAPLTCSTGGATEARITLAGDSAYYLIVPRGSSAEGSYGTSSAGLERPQGSPACLPRSVASCE